MEQLDNQASRQRESTSRAETAQIIWLDSVWIDLPSSPYFRCPAKLDHGRDGSG